MNAISPIGWQDNAAPLAQRLANASAVEERLTQQLASLDTVMRDLIDAGLHKSAPFNMAKTYRRRVAEAIESGHKHGFHMPSLAGESGENGWAPAIRSILTDATFWLERGPIRGPVVTQISDTRAECWA